MHICASKRSIDSARWPLHFNNSHVDGLRSIYGVYFVFVDRRSLVTVYVIWLEDHYGDLSVKAIFNVRSLTEAPEKKHVYFERGKKYKILRYIK